MLFCFSNQQNRANTASDCYFKADTESASSAYIHGRVSKCNPTIVSASSASTEAARVPVVDAETARWCKDGYRLTPVMPHRPNRNKQLVEFNSHDGGSASSSPSSGSCVQTPVISDASKDSNLSDEICQLLPGGHTSAEHQLELSLENNTSLLNSVQVGGQLVHCSSETNLVSATGSVTRPNQSHRTHKAVSGGRKVVGKPETSVSAEYAQQLRRRSRSADNLSRRHKQKADSAAWSAVDIDIGAHTESTVIGRAQQLDVQQQQQLKQSNAGNKAVDSLPSPFTTTRLRPFRQQMNSVVVSLQCDNSSSTNCIIHCHRNNILTDIVSVTVSI